MPWDDSCWCVICISFLMLPTVSNHFMFSFGEGRGCFFLKEFVIVLWIWEDMDILFIYSALYNLCETLVSFSKSL